MNKQITSILLCFVMLFSVLVSAVPAYAAPVNPPMIYIEPDKTEASPGDTITYKFYLQQPDTMTAFAFNIVVPDGLTCIADSGTLGSSASAAWGSTFEWVPEADLQLQWYSSSGDDVTDTSKIELLTIKFTVDDDATIGAECEVSLKNMQLAAGSTQNYDDISSTVEVTTAKVKIVAKPVAVTGVTIDETLSLKTGESKDLTVTVNPSDATNKEVTFSVTGDAVTVDANGKVTGVKKGTATVTVTTVDGNFTDTCTVTVACAHTNKTTTDEKASDCKDQGWDAYSTCDACGQLFNEAGEEISAIPFRPLSTQHTGGTPTCTAQAVCTVCSQPYGDLLDHDFTKEEKKAEALKTAGDCCKEAVYIKSCVHCGQVDTDENNTFLGEKDPDNHANYGTYLDGVVAVDHKNGVDGYTGDKKCNECDALIEKGQAILAGAHVPTEDWSTDSTYHWKECTVTGCGVVINGSKAEHTSEKPKNKAACGKQAVCDVCGVGYGEIPQHNYGTEKPEQPAEIGKTGLKAHYQCSECDKYFVDVEHDTHVEKKEVAYEDLIIPALVDNELTFEIPFSVVVKKTGDLDPAKETFTFKMFDLGYANTVYTVEGLTVETNGVNTYTGKLVIKVKESQFGNLSEGFKFAQVKGSADGWTYDETVYYIAPQISDSGATSFVIFPGDDGFGNTTLEKVEFTNSYNKAADNPSTGDNSNMFLWIALLFVSGCGVVVTTVLDKKRHSVR